MIDDFTEELTRGMILAKPLDESIRKELNEAASALATASQHLNNIASKLALAEKVD